MSVDLSGYVEVKDRIASFHKQYPEGSLQSSWRVVEIAGETLIVAEARAFRGPEDKRPGEGKASEPFPGKTPYTKDSELMNAETSAWGRALAALGFEVSRSIASREEVAAREGNGGESVEATGPQKGKVTRELNDRVPEENQDKVREAFKADTKSGASRLIDLLVKGDLAPIYREAGLEVPTDIPLAFDE